MPHSDSSSVPAETTPKAEFWDNLRDQLEHLLANERRWVTNLANASTLIFNALLAFEPHFGNGDRAVNLCGFYLISSLFPEPRFAEALSKKTDGNTLILGPFCGKLACQFVNVSPGRARGARAGAFLQGKTVVVQNVDEYPGHIACDGVTKSKIVCPLILQNGNDRVLLGVLDMDCLALGGFEEQDKSGLEAIADVIVKGCDW